MKKVTVLGDIMCEPPVLKRARTKDGYDFSGMFVHLGPRLAESDFVIGNLEFPMAGREAKYTDTYVVFNTPDEFAVALKEAGVDVVSTVNNHTLDRGYEGMIRTLGVLDRAGLDHTGNFLPEAGREEAYYFKLGEVKIALIAYTYSTNEKLPEGSDAEEYINYLRNSRMPTYTPEVMKRMNSWVERLFKNIKEENQARIRRLVGLPPVVIRPDDVVEESCVNPYLERFVSDIKKAKEKADYVICYPHVGGQFNEEPGDFSKLVMNTATEAGADIVIASHSHLVQRSEVINGVFAAYSIGNVSMCSHSPMAVKRCLPGYGIMMHLYFEGKELVKKSFSIIVAVERAGKILTVYPLDLLYSEARGERKRKKIRRNAATIYKTFVGRDPDGEIIKKEYDL